MNRRHLYFSTGRFILACAGIAGIHATGTACPECRPIVATAVYSQGFAETLFILLLPIAVLLGSGLLLYISGTRRRIRDDD